MFLVALMQDAVLPALVPVVDAHLVWVTSSQKLKPFDVKCEMLVHCSKSEKVVTNQKEHEKENPADPWGDKPRTVTDPFHQ